MKTKLYISAAICLLSLTPVKADVVIDFDDPSSYRSTGIYDVWEQSPFRTGELKGNWKVTSNPDRNINKFLGTVTNGSQKVLGAQRSRFGSNRFGARVDLNDSFKISPDTLYVHVMVHKPKDGRVMLVGLGSREERTGQNPYTEQFRVLSETPVVPGSWSDAVFPVRGAKGIDIRSLVLIPDCESPHNFKEDFLFYIDDIVVNNSAISRTPYDMDKIAQTNEDNNNINSDYIVINDSQLNGEVLAADGSKLDSYKAKKNQDFKIKVAPEKGFHNGGVDIYVFGNRDNNTSDTSKAKRYHIPPKKFNKDNTYVIPADVLQGNVLIQGIMIEDKAK